MADKHTTEKLLEGDRLSGSPGGSLSGFKVLK